MLDDGTIISCSSTNYPSLFEQPKYAGGWEIGGNYGLRIMIVKKPNWFHRYMMKLLLGIKWINVDDNI